MKSARKYWIIAILVSFVLVALGLLELVIRRDTTPSFYLLNKAVACTGLLMIVLSYSFSAIHHFYPTFRVGMALRRPFGITGYGLALLHVGITLTVADPSSPSRAKFPFPDFFLSNWPAILFALIGLLYFSFAFAISIKPERHCLTPAAAKVWRRRLRYGYLATMAAILHAGLLKYEGWLNWLATNEPFLPPLSLIALTLCTGFVLLKATQLIKIGRLF